MERNILLYGLALGCPINSDDPKCPLYKLRDLPVKERVKYIKSLTEKQQSKLLKQHDECIKRYDNNYFHKIKK